MGILCPLYFSLLHLFCKTVGSVITLEEADYKPAIVSLCMAIVDRDGHKKADINRSGLGRAGIDWDDLRRTVSG
jgi:hypothetical protein